MSEKKTPPFAVSGINHLALVCSNMEKTVEFYEDVLGFPLIKTVELPGGGGQHFFFDIGGGNHLAFFWFPDAPAPAPGIAAAAGMPGGGDLTSAVGSMNHVAFTIPLDKFDEYREKLIAAGVNTGVILNHDDSESTVAQEMHPGVFVRSLYFQDPDGILLEFACYTRELTDDDVKHAPANQTVGA
ncbi:MAG: VOC family protein [Cumulibacter sp.]